MAMMGGKSNAVFLDTNILIRLIIPSAPEHPLMRQALEQLTSKETEIWISQQVLRETAVVMTRPQPYAPPLSSNTAANLLIETAQSLEVAEETTAVKNQLFELMKSFTVGGKQIHDANIVATMLVYGIPTLLTLNTVDFERYQPLITLLSLDALLSEED